MIWEFSSFKYNVKKFEGNWILESKLSSMKSYDSLSSITQFSPLCVQNANNNRLFYYYLPVFNESHFPKFMHILIHCSFKIKESGVISVEQLAIVKKLFSDSS